MRISHIISLFPLGSVAVTFTSCTPAQVSTLEVAIDRATNKSYAAIEHLEANPTGSEIQTTWYGAFSTERYNRVLTAFKATHFRDVLGTTDYGYGVDYCKQFALEDPEKAVKNAE
ncbi:hypothetical protein SLS63_009958 [Diaporthe eres]|uniref:Lysine-specific metallo-endopeptidase domain-containing protein n=1 Tax=Diaporthe eres TaxID=83184 RepID=A0ABR1NYH1_DIAER